MHAVSTKRIAALLALSAAVVSVSAIGQTGTNVAPANSAQAQTLPATIDAATATKIEALKRKYANQVANMRAPL
jgi:Skp family chaperone for outer membrane proteins